MEKAPSSLARSELSADVRLHRFLRGPVSKSFVPQEPSLQGEMLQETLGPPHVPGTQTWTLPLPQLMLRL